MKKQEIVRIFCSSGNFDTPRHESGQQEVVQTEGDGHLAEAGSQAAPVGGRAHLSGAQHLP